MNAEILAVTMELGEITLSPGQDVTPPIPFRVVGLLGTRQGGDWPGGRARISMQNPSMADLVMLYDAYGVPSPDFIVGPAGPDGAHGRAAFRIKQAAVPGGTFTDLSLRAVDVANPQLAGGSSNWVRVTFQPLASAGHVVELYNAGTKLGSITLTGPVDLRLVLDGKMLFPASIFSGSGLFG